MNSEKLPSKEQRPRKKPAKFKKAPGAPRRFKSAYMFYSTEKHKSIRAELKEMGRSEPTTAIAKMVSKSWKELPFTEREKFEEKARKDKARYDVEKATYTGPWRVSTKKRAPKDPAAPKRPMSAFLAFSHAKRPEAKVEYPTANNTELSRILAEKWRNAPDEEKKEFVERELIQRQNYKEEIAVWREAEKKKMDRERMQREEIAMQRADELARAAGTTTVTSTQFHSREGERQPSQRPTSSITHQPTHHPDQYGQAGEVYKSSHQTYVQQQPHLQQGQEQAQYDESTKAAAHAYDPRYHYSYFSPYQAYGHDIYQWQHYSG